MHRLPLLILLIPALALSTRGASAQACLGLPSFANGLLHFNVSAEFPEDANAWAVGLGAGRPNNLFATIGAGLVSFDGSDEKARYAFLEFGFQLPLGRAQLCPVAGGSLASGPDDEAAGIEVTSSSAAGGIALGLPLGSGNLQFIPNAAVKYTYASQKLEETGIGSTTESFNSGILDLGLALVVSDRVSIQPLVHVPFAGDDEETTFGVFGSVSFGWPAR
jgi:hypothetical protein